MKKRYAFYGLLLFGCSCMQAMDLVEEMNLRGKWRFELGDNPAYAQPAFDDAKCVIGHKVVGVLLQFSNHNPEACEERLSGPGMVDEDVVFALETEQGIDKRRSHSIIHRGHQ